MSDAAAVQGSFLHPFIGPQQQLVLSKLIPPVVWATHKVKVQHPNLCESVQPAFSGSKHERNN